MRSQFYGQKTELIENDHLRLEYLLNAGPRLVRLSLAGSDDNLLAEVPEKTYETPYGVFHVYGGHRLWHAPEAFPRTYHPDNDGFAVEKLIDGARLTGGLELGTGLRKRIELHLAADHPGLILDHSISNEGAWAVELAPWAITMLRLGGWLVLPQQVGPLDPAGLLPNRQLVLWPYASWNDPRLKLYDDFVCLQAQAQLPPLKIGAFNRAGWVAYLRNGVLFRKRFTPQPDLPHVDFGCNVESYNNDQFIEMETLGPLARIEPGGTISHREEWEFTSGMPKVTSFESLREILSTLVDG
jgi:hypothetical protein